jgi:hypothetical protein
MVTAIRKYANMQMAKQDMQASNVPGVPENMQEQDVPGVSANCTKRWRRSCWQLLTRPTGPAGINIQSKKNIQMVVYQ